MSLKNRLERFFGPVKGSMKGIIIQEELYRTFILSTTAGSFGGLLCLLILLMIMKSSDIFHYAIIDGLITTILTMILDLLRRQNQGEVMHPKINNEASPTIQIPTEVTLKKEIT